MTIQTGSPNELPRRRVSQARAERRGMLILLVVLMLALFMAIGAWLLTIALRSRASARSFGASSLATSMNPILYREVLDEALLAALRGSSAAGNGSVATTGTTPATDPIFENLLDDKYGKPITGSASILAIPNAAYITLSLTSLSLPPVVSGTAFVEGSGTVVGSQLNGRIMTIAPPSSDVLSYRILGASGSATVINGTSTGTITCHIATPPAKRYAAMPSGTFAAVVNGREFTPQSGTSSPESYDAYDDDNMWLAEPVISGAPSPGQVAFINRISFFGDIFPSLEDIQLDPDPLISSDVIDNDNDGVPDGILMPKTLPLAAVVGSSKPTPFPRVLPDRPSPLGGSFRFQVSYLILDLDGRININTTGAADTITSVYGSTPADVPLGMGYGPADLDPSRLFPITLPNSTVPVTGTTPWAVLLKSGTPTLSGTFPSASQRRQPPSIGFLEGRYGQNGTPGVAGDEGGAAQSTFFSVSGSSGSSYSSMVSSSSGFADLQGRRKIYMQPAAATGEISPTLTIFTGSVPLGSLVISGSTDATDDPYELRLDADAPRPAETARLAASGSATAVNSFTSDNPFVIAELEPVLRFADSDAIQLPQRLAASLAGNAQQARMTTTTDSWDTPALTGAAANAIGNFLTLTATTSGYLSLTYSGTPSWRTTGTTTSVAVPPDIAAGLRFNINRPLITASDRYNYCKHLYTLVLMLRGTSAAAINNDDKQAAAQWAVNALDFRDDDDVITIFEYDTNILDGWNVDGDPNTTSETTRGVVCGAERPDVLITENAASDGTKPGEVAQLLITLRRMPHVVQTVGTSSTPVQVSGSSLALTSPEWQLRLPSNQIVRFPPSMGVTGGSYALFQSGSISFITPSLTFSGSFASGTNALTSGTNAHVCISPPSVGMPFVVNGIPRYMVTSGGTFALPAATSVGTIFLERLADPTNLAQAGSALNPYIVVDQAPVKVDSTSHPRSSTLSTHPSALFWATNTNSWLGGGTSLGVFSGTAPWYHWPNRPFISQAELVLVPTGTSASYRISTDWTFPISSLINSSQSIPFVSGTVSGSASLGNMLTDATYVPSRFAGNSSLISGTLVSPFGLDLLQSGSAELSKWREPGKVNVNTIVSGTTTAIDTDDIVWAILMSGTGITNPFAGTPRTKTQPANPGGPGVPATPATPGGKGTTGKPPKSIAQLLSLTGTSPPPPHYAIHQTGSAALSGTNNGNRDTNPFFPYSRAIRLANTATIRSQVFAIWITVKITDDSPNAPPPVTKRLFAIVDRSIPVGYAPGRDLNVRDTIRLKRYLD